MNNKISLSEILSVVPGPYRLLGETENHVVSFTSFFEASKNSCCFIKIDNFDTEAAIRNSLASVIICPNRKYDSTSFEGKSLILSEMPQIVFLRILNHFRASPSTGQIHETAIISNKAILEENVSIGAFCEIGDCRIGKGSDIRSFSKVHDGVSIGRNVLVSENCNVGGSGFGHIQNEVGELENFTHIGGVQISDDVEIFPFTNIDRGTLGDTFVGKGTKIDHYCHIGHNSRIGEYNTITCNVTVLGSVVIGDNCLIGAGTMIKEGCVIGDRVQTGFRAAITKNAESDQLLVGHPAREMDEFQKIQAFYKRLLAE